MKNVGEDWGTGAPQSESGFGLGFNQTVKRSFLTAPHMSFLVCYILFPVFAFLISHGGILL